MVTHFTPVASFETAIDLASATEATYRDTVSADAYNEACVATTIPDDTFLLLTRLIPALSLGICNIDEESYTAVSYGASPALPEQYIQNQPALTLTHLVENWTLGRIPVHH